MESSGFEVQGLRFKVRGLVFRVQDLCFAIMLFIVFHQYSLLIHCDVFLLSSLILTMFYRLCIVSAGVLTLSFF